MVRLSHCSHPRDSPQWSRQNAPTGNGGQDGALTLLWGFQKNNIKHMIEKRKLMMTKMSKLQLLLAFHSHLESSLSICYPYIDPSVFATPGLRWEPYDLGSMWKALGGNVERWIPKTSS